jgi:hypothetical protein
MPPVHCCLDERWGVDANNSAVDISAKSDWGFALHSAGLSADIEERVDVTRHLRLLLCTETIIYVTREGNRYVARFTNKKAVAISVAKQLSLLDGISSYEPIHKGDQTAWLDW